MMAHWKSSEVVEVMRLKFVEEFAVIEFKSIIISFVDLLNLVYN